MIARQMISLGYRVTLAASGDEALEILEESANGFDILLSDIMMPGKLDGVDLAKIVRARWPHLAVLLVSGFAGTAPQEDEAKAFPILRKPYRMTKLAQSLRLVLEVGGADRRPIGAVGFDRPTGSPMPAVDCSRSRPSDPADLGQMFEHHDHELAAGAPAAVDLSLQDTNRRPDHAALSHTERKPRRSPDNVER